MTDDDIIKQAYVDTVQKLFAALFNAIITAQTAAMHSQAEQRFQAGVRKAREVRDKAIALVS